MIFNKANFDLFLIRTVISFEQQIYRFRTETLIRYDVTLSHLGKLIGSVMRGLFTTTRAQNCHITI